MLNSLETEAWFQSLIISFKTESPAVECLLMLCDTY